MGVGCSNNPAAHNDDPHVGIISPDLEQWIDREQRFGKPFVYRLRKLLVGSTIAP